MLVSESFYANDDRYRYKGNEKLYGPKIAEYIESGFAHKAIDYVRSMNFRRDMQEKVKATLRTVDVLLMPTVSAPAPKDLTQTGDTRFQSAWSYTGFPSITIPVGLSGEGLPIGAQFASGPFREAKLLGAAHWAEQALGVRLSPPV